MAGQVNVLAALQKLALPHEIIAIDPDLADTAAFCQHYGYPLDHSCNTIVVAGKTEPRTYVACVVLATTRLDVNKRLKQILGVRASFATADEMRTVTGMEVGGVTPFALPAGMPLYVDARIPQLDWVILGGGGRDAKVKISPGVFAKLGAQVVTDLARADAGSGD